jgi:osmoprotectant transport system permease protein
VRGARTVLLAGLVAAAAAVPPRVPPAGAAETGVPAAKPGAISVGSKNFAENRLLAEMFARLVEDRTGLEVHRRLNLAGTQVCFEALRAGAIDLYPEYTGTGLVTILGEPADGVAATARNRVRTVFAERWNLRWMDPLGFENAYEIAMSRALADSLGIRTLSGLAPVSGNLRAGFGYEFIEREDGLPGLERAYGLRFRDVRAMQQALKYRAAGQRAIDVLDVYTTDGRLLKNALTVLDDDKGFFPPYEAAALVRQETLDRHPELAGVLSLLSGRLDEATMRGLNLRMEEEGETVERVAQDALESLGLVGTRAVTTVSPRNRSILDYMWANRRELLHRTLEHLALSALGLLLGIAVAVPLGLALERARRLAEPLIRTVGITQTIPSIALLAFMIPIFKVGALPAVVALWIYALYPILRNTYSGVRDAAPEAVQAALALGMTRGQALRLVRLPLAAPVIMAGIRTAAVITVGTTTLAAFIGAGGLGVPIVSGLQLADNTIILSGAIPAAVLAVLVDAILGLVERGLTPRGLVARS